MSALTVSDLSRMPAPPIRVASIADAIAAIRDTPRDAIVSEIERAVVLACREELGNDCEFAAQLNDLTGTMDVFHVMRAAANARPGARDEISLSEVQHLDADVQEGDELLLPLPLEPNAQFWEANPLVELSPLPREMADLRSHVRSAIEDVIERHIPAPSPLPGSVGELLLVGGGWAVGVAARTETATIRFVGSALRSTLYDAPPARWDAYQIELELEMQDERRRVILRSGDFRGNLRRDFAYATHAEARPRLERALLELEPLFAGLDPIGEITPRHLSEIVQSLMSPVASEQDERRQAELAANEAPVISLVHAQEASFVSGGDVANFTDKPASVVRTYDHERAIWTTRSNVLGAIRALGWSVILYDSMSLDEPPYSEYGILLTPPDDRPPGWVMMDGHVVDEDLATFEGLRRWLKTVVIAYAPTLSLTYEDGRTMRLSEYLDYGGTDDARIFDEWPGVERSIDDERTQVHARKLYREFLGQLGIPEREGNDHG